MTLAAAKLLDQAFATYMEVTRQPDGSGISNQSASWHTPSTPYDFAACLVRSLFPYAYNYDPADTNKTYAIWDVTVDALEILPMGQEPIDSILNPKPMCSQCGWPLDSYDHYTECRKIASAR